MLVENEHFFLLIRMYFFSGDLDKVADLLAMRDLIKHDDSNLDEQI